MENAEYLENNYVSCYTYWEVIIKMYIIFKILGFLGR